MLDIVHCVISDTHDPVADSSTSFRYILHKNTGLAQTIYFVLTQYWYKMWLFCASTLTVKDQKTDVIKNQSTNRNSGFSLTNSGAKIGGAACKPG
jgi:hypothetical protein